MSKALGQRALGGVLTKRDCRRRRADLKTHVMIEVLCVKNMSAKRGASAREPARARAKSEMKKVRCK